MTHQCLSKPIKPSRPTLQPLKPTSMLQITLQSEKKRAEERSLLPHVNPLEPGYTCRRVLENLFHICCIRVFKGVYNVSLSCGLKYAMIFLCIRKIQKGSILFLRKMVLTNKKEDGYMLRILHRQSNKNFPDCCNKIL